MRLLCYPQMGQDSLWIVMVTVGLSMMLVSCQSSGGDHANREMSAFSMTYQAGGMTTPLAVNGYEPEADGSYPVFVWITGTRLSSWSGDDQQITRSMAERGFVAVSVDYRTRPSYPTSCAELMGTVQDLFDGTDPNSAMSQINLRSKADITQGILVAGFSQGGNVAALAKNVNAGVEAAFVIGHGYTSWGESCYANTDTLLPPDRIRSIMGANDMAWPLGGNVATNRVMLEMTSGYSCGASALTCLQPDGSGWYLVQASETADSVDAHCFYYGTGFCGTLPFDREFELGNHDWSLQPSLDWLAGFANP